uniref:Transcription factor ovo-like protein 3 n=1 Tax=Diabrotica virgifera virgifera TaxID=50390 RepID=A0A6P7H8Y2_DIAVI
SSVHNCHVCGKQYSYRATLKRHLAYECGKLPQFSCHLCLDKAYTQKNNLRKHYYKSHGLTISCTQLEANRKVNSLPVLQTMDKNENSTSFEKDPIL